MRPCRVIQFAKEPKLGKVKTRMQPVLTQEQSLRLHCALVEKTYQTIESWLPDITDIWVAGDEEHVFFTTLRQKYSLSLYQQYGRDLGERLLQASKITLNDAEKVLIVGSDCPFLTPQYLQKALNALDQSDAVIGPASDGGYVLIGFKESKKVIFENVDWGESTVFAQTLKNFDKLNWSIDILPELPDIDRPEDLSLLDNILDSARFL